VLLGICVFGKASSFLHLSSGAGFWEILAPSIQWEIVPSIWVDIWCACDLGDSLDVSFRLGFRILLHYNSYVDSYLSFNFMGYLGFRFGF